MGVTLYTREEKEDAGERESGYLKNLRFFAILIQLLMVKLIRAQGGCLGTKSR